MNFEGKYFYILGKKDVFELSSSFRFREFLMKVSVVKQVCNVN
jgi:hypothetical protein